MIPDDARLLDPASGVRPRVDEEPLRPEPAVVEVRFGRLEEPVGEVGVGRPIEIRRLADEQRARTGDVESLDEGAEPVLVDELLDGLAWRDARREPLVQLRREAGHRERPLVAARDEDRPWEAQRGRGTLARAALSDDSARVRSAGRYQRDRTMMFVGVVDDVALDPVLRQHAQDPECREVCAEDQDRYARSQGGCHRAIISGFDAPVRALPDQLPWAMLQIVQYWVRSRRGCSRTVLIANAMSSGRR